MLRIVFYAVVGILILSFFGISLQSIVHSPAGQANFGYVGSVLSAVWDFIAGLAVGLYEFIGSLIPHH